MSYRNKTYVIFDGDKDMWAYAYMKGWNQSEHIEFSFYDAHDLRPLADRASEETVPAAASTHARIEACTASRAGDSR